MPNKFTPQFDVSDGLCNHCSQPKDAHTSEELLCPKTRTGGLSFSSSSRQTGAEPSPLPTDIDQTLIQRLADSLLPLLKQQLTPEGSREPQRVSFAQTPSTSVSDSHSSSEASRPHFSTYSAVPTRSEASDTFPRGPRQVISSVDEDSDPNFDERDWLAPPTLSGPRCFLPHRAPNSPATFDPDDRVSRTLLESNQGAYYEYLTTYSASAYLEEALNLADTDPQASSVLVQQVLESILHPRVDYLTTLALKGKAAARYVAGQTTLSTESQLHSPIARAAIRRFEARELSQLLPRAGSANSSSDSGNQRPGQRGNSNRNGNTNGNNRNGGGRNLSTSNGQPQSSSPTQQRQQQHQSGQQQTSQQAGQTRGRSTSRSTRS